jgi:hypothetical protein
VFVLGPAGDNGSRRPIGLGELWMSGLLYAHRVSKLLDELVSELGLTVTLSDERATVSLSKSMGNIKMAADQTGTELIVRAEGEVTQVTFAKK